MKYTFVFLVTVYFLTACASSQTGTPIASPTVPFTESVSEWNVSMTHSGGIMGLLRHITVNSSGEFTITDERVKQTKTGSLSPDDLGVLENIIIHIQAVNADVPKGIVCADCFVYSVEIQRGGKPVIVELNDMSLPNSGYEQLVTELRRIMENTLN